MALVWHLWWMFALGAAMFLCGVSLICGRLDWIRQMLQDIRRAIEEKEE